MPEPWDDYYRRWGVRTSTVPSTIEHIRWDGRRRTIEANFQLGVGVYEPHEYGLRRAVWDIAYGHVSGFRARDIAYYVITRSLSRRFAQWVVSKEVARMRRERDG